jgi:hypothetical protein
VTWKGQRMEALLGQLLVLLSGHPQPPRAQRQAQLPHGKYVDRAAPSLSRGQGPATAAAATRYEKRGADTEGAKLCFARARSGRLLCGGLRNWQGHGNMGHESKVVKTVRRKRGHGWGMPLQRPAEAASPMRHRSRNVRAVRHATPARSELLIVHPPHDVNMLAIQRAAEAIASIPAPSPLVQQDWRSPPSRCPYPAAARRQQQQGNCRQGKAIFFVDVS